VAGLEFLAGAAEPILSKRLQGRKANVVNEASSQADGKRETLSAGRLAKVNPCA
jgi:hypothetical protein